MKSLHQSNTIFLGLKGADRRMSVLWAVVLYYLAFLVGICLFDKEHNNPGFRVPSQKNALEKKSVASFR